MLTNQDPDVDIQLRLCYSQSLKPCKLQKLMPNNQFSFCWINLLLLTLLSIRFSWTPSHHWASQGFHFTDLNPTSMAGLSRWPGQERYPQNINWSLGFPRNWLLDPSSSPHTLPIIQAHGFSYHCYADDTQLYLSVRPDDPKVAARISGCLADISAWMKEHHLQLNLAKTKLLVFPATPTLLHDFTIQLGSSTITPSSSVRNLGVILMTSWLSNVTLQKLLDLAGLHCTKSERSGPSLHSMQHDFLSRPLSFLDWTTAMLF